MPEYRLIKYRGTYAVAYRTEDGRQVRRSLGTDELADAKRRFADVVKTLGKPASVTVRYLWEKYREDKAGRRIASNMDFSGRAVLPEFGDLAPDSISATLCRRYAEKRRKAGRGDGTIWTELNHLRIVTNWALKRKLITEPADVELLRKPDARDRRLSREEVRRLIDSASQPHVRLAVILMLTTAARVGALLTLTWDRVDFRTGLISLRDPADPLRRKGRATVPMNDLSRPALEEARKLATSDFVIEWAGKPVKSVKRGFAYAAEKAGIADVSPHVIRHSAASFMAEDGVPMSEIATYLGHSDSGITERVYARFAPTHLKRAAASLDLSGVPSSSSPRRGGNAG